MGSSVIRAPLDGSRAYEAFNAAAFASADAVLVFHAAGLSLEQKAVDALSAALTGGVGIAVPTIADPGNRVISSGLSIAKTRLSPLRFEVVPRRAGEPFDERAFPEDVTAASVGALAIDRALFIELGGFSERFADALADVDLSLRVRERGLRIVCVRSALVTLESTPADCNDPRRIPAARARLDAVWRSRIDPWIDPSRQELRETRVAPERYLDLRMPARPIAAFIYGDVPDTRAFREAFLRCGAPVTRVVWNSPSEPPDLGVPLAIDRSPTTSAARAAMELRGERAVAFVNAARPLAEGWLESLVRELAWGSDVVAAMLDGRTLLALPEIPQHLRLDERLELEPALVDLLARLQPCGLAVRGAELGVKREAPALRADALTSIIMLSWNAPQYTKIALDSISEHTPEQHEVIIVDNGSDAETTDWLKLMRGNVRVILNPVNRGFAGGNNQGLALARGEYIVILNNDVVVTEGWLGDLHDALRRNPLTGVSAPRSNRVAGAQMIADADYPDVAAMHRYAAARRIRWRKTGFYVDRAIGFCLCIDRRVVDEIGGIDERFGAGNFEDDDFSMRVRAAGYKIYVCDDVFIHHFGSVTFAANKIDWQASMHENWTKFARKWGLEEQFPLNGYQPQPVIARGFDRALHYIPLTQEPGSQNPVSASAGSASAADEAPEQAVSRREARVRFAAIVRDESDWSNVGAFVRRFARAFDIQADVTLEIAACGTLDASILGERVMRLLERNGMDANRVAEIGIDDVRNVDAWLDGLAPASLLRIQGATFGGAFDALALIEETSPSSLRRVLAELVARA